MTNLMKYNAANLDQLMDRITRNTIGMDDYFDRLFKAQEQTNYPPYNLIQVSETEVVLELALAGFKEDEVNVYTQEGKLYVEGKRGDTEEKTYVHRGVAARSFTRAWTLSDETEVRSVTFENGLLTVTLGRIVPEHHQRKDWF
jgi:HSP20 family molecular chaperone IbpA